MKKHSLAIVLPFFWVVALSAAGPSSFAQPQQNRRLTRGRSIPTSELCPLTSIAGLDLATNGRLFALDPQEQQICQFDKAGRFEKSFGKKGRGPGEVVWPTFSMLHGNRVWLLDATLFRAIGYGLAGQTPKTISYPMQSFATAILANETFLSETPRSGPVGSSSVTHLILTISKSHADTIAEVRKASGGLQVNLDGIHAVVMQQPFLVDPDLWRVPQDGRSFFFVRASETQLVVNKYDLNGFLTWKKIITVNPIPVSTQIVDRMADRLYEQLVKNVHRRLNRSAIASIARQITRTKNLPPLTDAIAGRDGSLWLRLVDDTQHRPMWIVLGPRGNIEYSVMDLSGVHLLSVALNDAWGWEEADDGTPTIMNYGIVR